MRPAGGLRAAAAMATVAVLALLDDATVFAQVTSGLGDTETLEVHARPVLETASDLGSHAETLTADDVGDAQAWSMDDLLRREPSFGVFRVSLNAGFTRRSPKIRRSSCT